MRVIKPIDILKNGELIGSNLGLYDYPVYSATTTYNAGDKVTYNNKNYEAITNAMIGNQPDLSIANWLDIGVTNSAAPFDQVVGTKAVNALEINYQIAPLDLVSVIALLNVQGQSVTVTMTDAIAGQVYNRTISLSDSAVDNWHSYFFAPYENKDVAIFDDIPAYAGAVIDITVLSSATVELGTIIAGYAVNIGEAKWGISLGITDYSRKEIDPFGNASLLKRDFSSNVNVSLSLSSDQVDIAYKRLSRLRSTPCLYLVANQFTVTFVYGYYRDFNVTIASFTESVCSLELRGLI